MGPVRLYSRSRRRSLSLLLIGVLGLSGCTTAQSDPTSGPATGRTTPTSGSSPSNPTLAPPSSTPDPSGPASAAAPRRTASLRVMTFNIEYGGTGVDFSSVAKAVEAAHADVVAVNEGYGNIPRLAAELGWRYYDVRTQVMSRLPLLTPPMSDGLTLDRGARTTDGRAVFVEITPGHVAAIVNVHLPSAPYSPFKVEDGAPAGEIVALEKRVRVHALRRPLMTARQLVAAHTPVFVLGDFNSPSDLDWTKAAVGLRDQVRYPLHWPASRAAESSGLVDSYRAVHPNPVTSQGLTWPASRPFVEGYNPGPAGQAADRIDLLFSGGPARAVESSIVGERGSRYSDIVVSPWPSDHRAVVSQFKVTPAPAPTLVSVRSRLVPRGRSLVVDYASDAGDARSVVVTPVDLAPLAADPRADPLAEVSATDAASGTERIDTTSLRPGMYEAGLVDGSGTIVARMAFSVEQPGATALLRTSRRSYRPGARVGVSWWDAPGERNDWLGLYKQGGDPATDSYLGWTYIGAEVSGGTWIDAKINGIDWPLKQGDYSIFLLKDDGYDVLAKTSFGVR